MYRFDVKDILKEAALEDLEEQAEQSAVALQKISATGTKFQEVGGKSESVGKTLLPVSVDLGATTAFSSGEVAEAMNTYTQLGLDDAKNEMIRMECQSLQLLMQIRAPMLRQWRMVFLCIVNWSFWCKQVWHQLMY